MSRAGVKLTLYLTLSMVICGWVGLMTSYWLPQPAGHALMATSLVLAIPALIAAILTANFEEELVEYGLAKGERERVRLAPPPPMRCTECGTRILDAGGTTVGDQLEGEIMMLDQRALDQRNNPYGA